MFVLLLFSGLVAGLLWAAIYRLARRGLRVRSLQSQTEIFLTTLLPALLVVALMVWLSYEAPGAHGAAVFVYLLVGALGVPGFLWGGFIAATVMMLLESRSRRGPTGRTILRGIASLLLGSLLFWFFADVALLWFMIRGGEESMLRYEAVPGAVILLALGLAVAQWCSSVLLRRGMPSAPLGGGRGRSAPEDLSPRESPRRPG